VASVAPNPNSSFLPMLYPHILEKVALHAVSENRASPHAGDIPDFGYAHPARRDRPASRLDAVRFWAAGACK